MSFPRPLPYGVSILRFSRVDHDRIEVEANYHEVAAHHLGVRTVVVDDALALAIAQDAEQEMDRMHREGVTGWTDGLLSDHCSLYPIGRHRYSALVIT